MLHTKTQEIIDGINTKRIALLTEIIITGNELSKTYAIYFLSMIPTKNAAETILTLIAQTSNINQRYEMASALIAHSPFRDEMRPLLEALFLNEIDHIAMIYEEIPDFDPRLALLSDVAKDVAEALEAQFTLEITEITRTEHRGPWLSD